MNVSDPSLIKTLPIKKKTIFLDSFVPFLDWQKIRTWDLWIAGCNNPLILGHLSFWNGNLPLNAKKPIAADVEDYERLKDELNAETFLKIGSLLDQRAQTYLRNLLPEATAEYTLEGSLRSLHQEMTSPLLKTRMEKIQELKMALFSENSFLHEKELVKQRQLLEDNLAALKELVDQIGEKLPGFSSFQAVLNEKNPLKALSQLADELDLQLVFIQIE